MTTKAAGFAATFGLLTLSGFAAPDIAVVDPTSVLIPDGSTQTSLRTGTDFGHAAVTNGQKYITYGIFNTGDGPLTLNGVPEISGTHAADFTLNAPPTSPVNLNTYFSIKFDPSANGVRTGLVTIQSNDPDEGTYTFAISGTGGGFPLAGPDMSVDIPLPPKVKIIKSETVRVSGKFVYQNLGPIAMNGGIAQVFLSEDRVLDPQDPMVQEIKLKTMPAPVGEKIKIKKKKFKGDVPFDGDGGFVFVRILPLPFSVEDINWSDNIYAYLYSTSI